MHLLAAACVSSGTLMLKFAMNAWRASAFEQDDITLHEQKVSDSYQKYSEV